jgi:1,2-dihydroxy-3-keto-5-methylthiopentene dioxygenase
MSRLTVWDADKTTQILVTEDPEQIASELKAIGVRFERWPLADIPGDAEADAILAAYRPHLDAFLASTGAGTADVIKLTPDHPMKDALRS